MISSVQIIENKVRDIDGILKVLNDKSIEIFYKSYPHLKTQFLDSSLVIKEELSKMRELFKDTDSILENIEDLSFIIDTFISEINQISRQSIEDNIRSFRSVLANLKGFLKTDDGFKFDIDLDKVPVEIKDEFILDIEEARKCFSSEAYRGTLAFCGRALELVLSKKYFDKTGKDPIEENWMLGTLIGKCSQVGILSDKPSLGHFCNIINDTRISSIHHKKNIYNPERDETLSLVGISNALIKKLLY